MAHLKVREMISQPQVTDLVLGQFNTCNHVLSIDAFDFLWHLLPQTSKTNIQAFSGERGGKKI